MRKKPHPSNNGLERNQAWNTYVYGLVQLTLTSILLIKQIRNGVGEPRS